MCAACGWSLRPWSNHWDDDGENTKKISREHTVMASKTGLVTVTGGKWTTYRAMSEGCAGRMLPDRSSASRPAGDRESAVGRCAGRGGKSPQHEPEPGPALLRHGCRRGCAAWCAELADGWSFRAMVRFLPPVLNTRAPSRTCWRAAVACFSSMPARLPRSRPR